MALQVGEKAPLYKEGEVIPEMVGVTKGGGAGPRPKLLPFTPRRPKTNAECVIDEFQKNAGNVDGVVILYRTKDGAYNFTSDQGDAAGTLLFVERAKLKLLEEESPDSPSAS